MDVFLRTVESLLRQSAHSPRAFLWMLVLSGLLGITHTLGPGHGKTLLLGVLVAESRRVGHALKMALVIGVTHMADVLILSGASILLVSSLTLDPYSHLIARGSGVGILLIGLYRAVRVLTRSDARNSDRHEHSHDEAGHNHERENLMTAFLYSLVPCPGAWILFMACLGAGEPITGVFLLLGFTAGLLATIGTLALSIVYSVSWFEPYLPEASGTILGLLSALVIILLGVGLLVEGGRGHAAPERAAAKSVRREEARHAFNRVGSSPETRRTHRRWTRTRSLPVSYHLARVPGNGRWRTVPGPGERRGLGSHQPGKRERQTPGVCPGGGTPRGWHQASRGCVAKIL